MAAGTLVRPGEGVELLEQGTTGVELPAKVILYNDDWHTFEEVIVQLMKATGCTRERAEALTWEVHTRGKAAVYEGELSQCLRVSAILEEIALHTQIEC
jgi:ATP-dependent Clp protease adaptor protein ClpS